MKIRSANFRCKTRKGSIKNALIFLAASLIISSTAAAATLKSGTCRGVSTSDGYKYVGTYCVDYACTVVTTLMVDHWCPYSIDY